MKILVVEDIREQQQTAREAIEAEGHQAVVVDSIKDAIEEMPRVDGVITDLHFPPFGNDSGMIRHQRERGYLDNPPPSGLTVVIAAVHLGKPVVICTDGGEGGHHGATLSWLYDGMISWCFDALGQAKMEQLGVPVTDSPDQAWSQKRRHCPFGWEESKNWANAIRDLVERLS